jgi:hypothetical protein
MAISLDAQTDMIALIGHSGDCCSVPFIPSMVEFNGRNRRYEMVPKDLADSSLIDDRLIGGLAENLRDCD